MIKKYTLISIAISAIVAMIGCGPDKPVLNVYMWSDYIDMDIVKEFEQENDCIVKIDNFDSNEFMYSKINSGAKGYDVVMPTGYMAKTMFEQNLVDTLDKSKLPNLVNIDKKYLDSLALDKDMQYTVPYMIGFTCIAYNKDKIGNLEKSWSVFGNEKYKSRMIMLDDAFESIGAGLKYLGYSMNSTDPKAIAKAKDLLMQWKKNLAKFDNEVYKNGLSSGEFYIVQGYSGDLFQVMEDRDDLAFMIPAEGTSVSCDNWAILSSSKQKELAYKFIDFTCRKDIAARNMEATYYSAPIVGAIPFLPEELQNHPGINIDPVIYENSEAIFDLGEDRNLFINAWEEIKLGR